MGFKGNIEMAFIGAKGGVGTTGSTLLTAQRRASEHSNVLLVDLSGDLGVVLGTAGDLPGLAEAARAPERFDVRSAIVDVAPSIRLVPKGDGALDPSDAEAWRQVWDRIEAMRDVDVLIDAGRGRPALDLAAHSHAGKVLVMNCCYQALHRGRGLVPDVDAVVVQTDTQRALGLADIEAALGRHADAVVAADRSVSRWLDAGLILDRTAKSANGLDGLVDVHEFRRTATATVASR